MTPIEILLDEIEKYDKLATPGPWAIYTSNSFRRIGKRDEYCELISPVRSAGDGHPDLSGRNVDHDLNLLMVLRNALPMLVAGVEAMNLQIETMHIVLSGVSAKAGISGEKLVELLKETESDLRAASTKPLH